MTPNTHDTDQFEQFVKNRYFDGKLLTARDMAAEQRYHARRLQTLARHALGSGVVRGLDVRAVETDADGLAVTLGPGLAIDGRGRPLVVEGETTRTVPEPASGPVFLQLRHAETPVEQTLAPEDDSETANRLREGVEVTYTDTPPERPTPSLDGAAGDAESLARRYHERRRDRGTVDPAVPIGAIDCRPGGRWTTTDDGPPRPIVYDNDLLFAVASASGDRGRETPSGADGSGAVSDRLDEFESRLATVERDRDELARYLLGAVSRTTVRLFEDAADRLSGRDGDAARAAQSVADAAASGSEGIGDGREALVEAAIEFGEALAGVVTTESRQRYLGALSTLQTTVEEDPTALALATAQDDLADAADRLAPVYDVVPEGDPDGERTNV